jgi:hypothetical protein
LPIWSLFGVSAVALVGLVMAVQLLQRSSRTGGWSERLFAFALLTLLAGFAGWVLHVSALGWLSQERVFLFYIGGEILTWIGCTALFFGTWRFYRPDSWVAIAVAALASAAHLTAVIHLALGGEVVEPCRLALAPMTVILGRALSFAWWGGESIVYYGKMKKRVAIGLADPVVASRFLMLGVAAFGVSACMLTVPATNWIFERAPREMPSVLAGLLVVASIALVCAYCAFLQPKAYQRIVKRRMAAPDPT